MSSIGEYDIVTSQWRGVTAAELANKAGSVTGAPSGRCPRTIPARGLGFYLLYTSQQSVVTFSVGINLKFIHDIGLEIHDKQIVRQTFVQNCDFETLQGLEKIPY